MTARQERRLEQKLARKALKKDRKQQPLAEADPNITLPELAGPDEKGAECPSCAPEQVRAAAVPISAAKLAANVANAQLSTGATSDAGKAIVSQNATKHGLTGKFKVLPSESQFEFDRLLAGFLHAEAPTGPDEVEMVHQMAKAVWLSRRCLHLQNDCFAALECASPEDQRAAQKSLALYMRYQTMHDRTFSRYAAELRKRRNERARAERGFVSQKHKQAAEIRRQANENRKKDAHEMRQAIANCRLERLETQNRLAKAKAECLEMQNAATKQTRTMAAAA